MTVREQHLGGQSDDAIFEVCCSVPKLGKTLKSTLY